VTWLLVERDKLGEWTLPRLVDSAAGAEDQADRTLSRRPGHRVLAVNLDDLERKVERR
jgi:hypothetical protein